MRIGAVNSRSLVWSIAIHTTLLTLGAVLTALPSCRRKELAIPLDFTVVLDKNLIEPNVPQDEPQQPEPPQPEPQVEPEPAPPQPAPLPPKDVVPVEKKEPEKKVEPKKQTPPKPPPKKPDPPKPTPPKPEPKKPFVKGKRVEAPKQPRFEDTHKRFDPTKPVSTKPVTDKKLSRAEIEKALGGGARAGTRNVIPEGELSRCVFLVKRALYEAWDQPGAGDAGRLPALLDIRLDSGGRIVSYRIRQSSGSAYFDQTVLKAAANCKQISGLTVAFLKQYENCTIEFKLE